MNFYDAMVNDSVYNNVVGENGMPAHSTSGSYLLDLFFRMGAGRKTSTEEMLTWFNASFQEDRLMTVKSMFYNRDVRGGQGERKSFRAFFRWLCVNYPNVAEQVYQHVPFYGRWDDLLVALWSPIEQRVANYIWNEVKNGNALAAKWMPRENKANKESAKRLIYLLRLSAREYRKTLAEVTRVVETQMCENEWDEIQYEHVPSKAINKYRKAFARHDDVRYNGWLQKVVKGESKVNAGAIFPVDIVKKYLTFNWRFQISKYDELLEQQWKALPDYIKSGTGFLPVCDVSGSMSGDPILVSVSLGIYLAQRNKSVFKNLYVTFSESPTFNPISNLSLKDAIEDFHTSNWGMNTDLEKTFQIMLDRAVRGNVSPEDMPSTILIISDMQFDQCVRNRGANANTMLRNQFESHGYKFPNVVFWNVRNSTGIPVKMTDTGVALVSGYSPSVMKSILGGEVSPLAVMMRALNDPRYDRIILV